MSQRERWIIYPLLFLTFCLAIRDQWPLAKTSTGMFNAVQCRNLTIVDDRGDPAVVIGTRISTGGPGERQESGQIKILTHEPTDVGSAKSTAVLLTVSDDYRGVVQANGQMGLQLVQMSGGNAGGRVAFYDEKSGKRIFPRVIAVRPSASEGGVTLSPPHDTQPNDEENPRAAKPRPPMPPNDEDDSA